MGMMQEFKAFAVRGNVVDMAVGIIIGSAFGRIVASLVGDVIMPPIGLALGNKDFTALAVVLKQATETTEAVTIGYGQFLKTVIDFLIIAWIVFLLIRGMNRMKRKEEAKPAAPPAPPKQEVLLEEIRDLLKSRA